MMSKLKAWIKAARPRTVLLSLSGVMMGGFLAASEPAFRLPVAIVATLTAILLQILSNLANDYGDYKKGVDNRAGLCYTKDEQRRNGRRWDPRRTCPSLSCTVRYRQLATVYSIQSMKNFF